MYKTCLLIHWNHIYTLSTHHAHDTYTNPYNGLGNPPAPPGGYPKYAAHPAGVPTVTDHVLNP